jgi:glutamate synthase (NADPH) large chain
VDLEPLAGEDELRVRALLTRHHAFTGSPRAAWMIDHWPEALARLIKVFPHEYKRVLGVSRLAGAAQPAARVPVAASGAQVRHG